MAGREVTGVVLDQRRVGFLIADAVDGDRAARVEAAADGGGPGWARRRCRMMRSRLRSTTGSGIGTAESSALVYGCSGLLVELVAVGQLDDLAQVHHRHAVADVAHHRQVVGDEQVGQVELRPAALPAG